MNGVQIVGGPYLPNAVAVHHYATEKEWLASRAGRPGSSDAAAILGVSTTRGPWDVYAERCLGMRSTIPAALARRGHREEQRIAEDYAEATGHTVLGPLRTLRVVGPRECYDSPDAWIYTGSAWVGGEFKTDVSPFSWGRSGAVVDRWTPEVARWLREDYLAQCYWHLACHGLPAWVLVVKRSMDDLRWYTIRADVALQERMLEAVDVWWSRHVVAGNPPPIDDSETCLRAQGRIFSVNGRRPKTHRDATEDEAKLIAEDLELTAAITAAEKRQNFVRSALASSIGEGYGVRAQGAGTALFTDVSGRVTVDREALELHFPDVYRKVAVVGQPTRQIRVYPERNR